MSDYPPLPVIEHDTTQHGRWLRGHRVRIAIWIAVIEGILVVLHVIPWWLAVIVGAIAVIFYYEVGRKTRSDAVRQTSWIVAASQVMVALVPILVLIARDARDRRRRAPGRPGADRVVHGAPLTQCAAVGRSQAVRQRVLVPRSQVRILAPQPSVSRRSNLAAVVMAGGLGTRMRSATPKHLHPLLGRRMVDWVIEAARPLGPDPLVVVTSPETADAFDGLAVAVQERAARHGRRRRLRASRARGPRRRRARPLRRHAAPHDRAARGAARGTHRDADAAATVLSFAPADVRSYGRIVRDADGRLRAIVEAVDASPEELAIGEVNSSIYVFRAELLWPALERLEPHNAQGELYLTDAVRAPRRGRRATSRCTRRPTRPRPRASTRGSSSPPRPRRSCATASTRRTCSRASGSSIPRRRGSSRRSSSRRTPSCTRSPCSAAPRRSPPAPRSARTSSPSTRRSARASRWARSATCGPAPCSRRARRQARSSS